MTEGTHHHATGEFEGAAVRAGRAGHTGEVVAVAEHPVEHESPEDWGWHGETGKWGRVGAVIATLAILAYLVGNHEGRVEDLWILGIALVMVIMLVWDWRRRKNAWRYK